MDIIRGIRAPSLTDFAVFLGGTEIARTRRVRNVPSGDTPRPRSRHVFSVTLKADRKASLPSTFACPSANSDP